MHYSLNHSFDLAIRIALIELSNHLIKGAHRAERCFGQITMLTVFAQTEHDVALVDRLRTLAAAVDLAAALGDIP